MVVEVTVAPATEPIDVELAKSHLRVTLDDDDQYIESLITAARNSVEILTQRALITQTRRLTLDAFPCSRVIQLPGGKIQSVTSVAYVDAAGQSQTLSVDRYVADTRSTPGRIILKDGSSWPSTWNNGNAVEVVYVAGFGEADAVPNDLIQAIHFLVAHWYSFREPITTLGQVQEIPKSVEYLTLPYRVWS